MRTTTIGEILREYREHYGLGLQELAQKTRIRQEHLEALEDNRYEALPSATYVKAYVKTYADLFGFDHQPLLAILRRDYKESAKGKLIPIEFIQPAIKKRQWWTPLNFILLTLVTLFLSLAAYIAIQWYNLNKPPFLVLSQPAEDAVVAARVVVSGETVTDGTLEINKKPVQIEVDGSFETEVFFSREGLNTVNAAVTDRRGKTNVIQRTVRVEF